MQLDRHELLAVRLGSGRVYLVPRAVLENLVHAYPEEALQLIVSASTTRGLLDPSGMPSEAGCRSLPRVYCKQVKKLEGLCVLVTLVSRHAH
jgi:hypothetical protein